jgi:hypothetical protein
LWDADLHSQNVYTLGNTQKFLPRLNDTKDNGLTTGCSIKVTLWGWWVGLKANFGFGTVANALNVYSIPYSSAIHPLN